MKYYAGLDVSMKETFICILDEEGKRVYEGSTESDPQPIYEVLTKTGFVLEKVGMEAGSISSYLTKGLIELGLNAICIDARKMAAILSVTVNKTDKNDARGIADAIRCNHYKQVNLRDISDISREILLKSRSTLVSTRCKLKNTIRGFLKSSGIRLGEVSNKSFTKAVQDSYVKMQPDAKLGIDGLLNAFERANNTIDQLDKKLKELCKEDELVRLLMTVPGVGSIVAMAFKSSLGDATRFKTSSSVGAYYGMAPRQYSSGETVKQGSISKCGDNYVRYLLVEAGTVLLTRCKKWSALKAWGLRIMKKSGLKKAAVAVARKLAVIMHCMLLTGEEFRFSKADLKLAA